MAGATTNMMLWIELSAPMVTPCSRGPTALETIPCRARVLTGAERDVIWTAHKTENPGFAGYEQVTSREIPVIILEPVDR